MHSFPDKNSENWNIELTFGLMEEIKARLEIDLLEPLSGDTPALQKLSLVDLSSIRDFVNVLYLACEEQAVERGMDGKHFASLLGSDTIWLAYQAFMEEWADFFQGLGRKDVTTAIRKVMEAFKMMVQAAVEKINVINTKEFLNLSGKPQE